MAIYADLSGNSPIGDGVDQRIGGHEDIQAIGFRGTVHNITLGAASVQSPVFSNRCRAIRISMSGTGEGNYLIGSNPTALKDGSDVLAGGTVEIVKVRGGVDKIAFIQQGSETDVVTIHEDLS